MSNVGFLAWWRFGRPAPGAITARDAMTYKREEALDLTARISQRFGDPADLAVVDLGAGDGGSPIAGQILRTPWKRLVSVEGFIPYLHKLQAETPAAAQHEIVESRIETFVQDMKPGEIDLALLINALDHLTRRDALATLRRLKKLVKKGIIVFTPLGHSEQVLSDQNAMQRQRSVWCARDFSLLEFEVMVYEGFDQGAKGALSAAWGICDLQKKLH